MIKNSLGIIGAALTLFAADSAHAGLHIWTGAVNGLWSNTNNWQSGYVPTILETPPVGLEFPYGVARTSVTNDIYNGFFGALEVTSLIITGDDYHLYGQDEGTNLVLTGEPAEFLGVNYQNLYCTGTNITFDSGLNLILYNTNTITNHRGSTLDMQATLTGTGGWTFEGLGEMTMDGSNLNTCSGICEVASGTLVLNRAAYEFAPYYAISGPLVIGTTNVAVPALVSESGVSDQFGAFDTNGDMYYPPVTIAPSGTFQIAGASTLYLLFYGADAEEIIGPLTMTGGVIALNGLVQYGQTNYGQLQVGGPLTVYPSANSSLITGEGTGAFQSASMNFEGYDIDLIGNSVLLMETPMQNYLSFDGFVPVNIYKTGTGTLVTTETNVYCGNTIIEEGIWIAEGDTPFGLNFDTNNAYYIGDGFIGPAENQVVVSNGAQIIAVTAFSNAVPVVLNGMGPGGVGAALVVDANGTRFSAGCTLGSAAAIYVGSGDELISDNLDNSQADVPPLAGSNTLYKQGPGTLALTMSLPASQAYTNVMSGACFVQEGTLELAGQSTNVLLLGAVTIGTNDSTVDSAVELLAPQQIASNVSVTLNNNGELDLGSYAQTIGSLTLNGGLVGLGNPLILSGNITAQDGPAQPEILLSTISLGGANRTITVAGGSDLLLYADISDGGNNAGITLAGLGEVDLYGSNTYGGSTLVNTGRLSLFNNAGLGLTNGGATIASGAEMVLNSGVSVGNKTLSLSGNGLDGLGALKSVGTNSWAGPVSLTNSASVYTYPSSQLELRGVMSGSGGLLKNGTGTLLLDGAVSNSYTGATTVQQGNLMLSKTNTIAVPGAVVIGNSTDGPDAEAVFLLQNGQLTQTASLSINPSGLLNVGNGNYVTAQIGALTGSGAIDITDGLLGVGNDNSSTSFAGAISGIGSFAKYGNGTLTLTGTSALTGPVYVVGGQLLVNGSLASSTVNVYSTTTLGGLGTVGPIVAQGIVNPGVAGAGILTSGTASLGSGSLFLANLNGTNAGSGYTQLNVEGIINLTNPTLQVSMGFKGASNNQYTIINNAAFEAINGTFAGLVEGATVTANNGAKFKISYAGGSSGRDVVLTQTGSPTQPKFSGIVKLAGGDIQLSGSGAAGVSYTVLANTNLNTTNWIPIGATGTNGTGTFQFVDTGSTNYPHRFYILELP